VARPAPWLIIPLASLLDALTTLHGLSLGLAEAGPIAIRLIPLLGPAYFALQLLLLLTLYTLLRRAGIPRLLAALAPSLGPLTAALANATLIALLTP